MDIKKTGTEEKPHIFWLGFVGRDKGIKYPAWRYHKCLEPLIVKDTQEDEEVQKRGYEQIIDSCIAHRGLTNWFWDIEDMSPKQLVVYAKDEWDIDLPTEADQEHLQKALFELVKWAPNSQGRVTFMAHEIKMNLDEVQQEIRDLTKNGMSEVEERVMEI